MEFSVNMASPFWVLQYNPLWNLKTGSCFLKKLQRLENVLLPVQLLAQLMRSKNFFNVHNILVVTVLCVKPQ